MSYINFDKKKLINLEYSLNKELLRSNRAGSYSSTTIIGCNTRKYHGLLITPQPNIDSDNHVLLSSLDETIVKQDSEFNLALHMYPDGQYFPKGHKYIRDFETEPIPRLTYRVGGVVLEKEMIFIKKEDRILIKYTLKDSSSPTILRLKAFLAFRNVHQLSKENMDFDKKYKSVNNGITVRMYSGYSPLYLQFSKEVEYTHVPDWYYNIEYMKEKQRGYEAHEDLYVPGFFEVSMMKGESIVFSAGTVEANPKMLKRLFYNEIKGRIPRNSFKNCLLNSAQQFIVTKGEKTEIIAGFPWFGRWGRDTFISLPGLTLVPGEAKVCKSVIDTMVSEMTGPLFPNIGQGRDAAYNSVDAPLWFFWTLQQYAHYTDKLSEIWDDYGDTMKQILTGFGNNEISNIRMLKNGLLYANEKGKALTWMDAIVTGKPVTPRYGLAVEINALWYNAIMFSLEVAALANDNNFIKDWRDIAEKIPASFKETFWDREKAYLADCVDNGVTDWSVRPNQIFAVSLPYNPVDEEIKMNVVNVVKQELLTPRGLRTLAPSHPKYKPIYSGNQIERDLAYHQGTAWPWLLGHFAEAYLKVYGKNGLSLIKTLYSGFEEEMVEHGIGSISEIYDGDPPHKSGGAISQAWSVAELLRISDLIGKYEKGNAINH